MDTIQIRGARTHNLKNISLDLPRDSLVVITGLSGSGKSSLAFDTLFAEGQRRYVESLSAYARQFLSVMEKPDVDYIGGLSPAISIEQKSSSHNPRSTVGTVTEIYDYLRLLFARAGTPTCPTHGEPLEAQTISQMVDYTLSLDSGAAMMLLSPVVQNRKGDHLQLFEKLRSQGYLRARVNGELIELDEPPTLKKNSKHTIDVVVDRFRIRDDLRLRLAESFETATNMSDGNAILTPINRDDNESNSSITDTVFSTRFACTQCGYAIAPPEPSMFSFNSPKGACDGCDGLGVTLVFDASRIVTDDTLSLADGAIRGWDNKTTFYWQMIEALASHFSFKTDAPFKKLTKNVRDIILYGSADEEIKFSYSSETGERTRTQVKPFEGVIPTLTRRYRETESSHVRDELAKLQSSQTCDTCNGSRLNEAARHVLVDGHAINELTALSIRQALTLFSELTLDGKRGPIAEKINVEITQRLGFLNNVGLDYLSLDRGADTLSGGESQRIRLASQIGAGLMGVMYVLDEPSIGLHQRDNDKLLKTLSHLRELGNTVVVVEHDEDTIRTADHVIDIGPGAGVNGGEIVASGTPADIVKNKHSLTGQYLSGARKIEVPGTRKKANGYVSITGASGHNLKDVDIDIPLGVLTCITGVSGSGKSTLINHTLYTRVANTINGASHPEAPATGISGLDNIDKIVEINQSAIGRTPRSNPATYSGLFSLIRDLFAGTQEARSRGYKTGRFSFNVKGGRCEACQGDGLIKVEMHFLPDLYVPCDLCKGKRYNPETLDIRYKGKNISEVLAMSVEEALDFFAAVPALSRKLQTLDDVGLSYITLGQNATTLSGGEAQRIKLAKELSRRDTGNTLYILDEPTTGLHFEDVRRLMLVINRLRDQGNTIVIIEHNLDVIKTADWIIDLGPEGGAGGGEIVTTGTPEKIAKNKRSYTGQYLKPLLKKHTR